MRLEHLLSGAMLSTIIVEKWYTRKAPWIVLHYVVYDIYSNQLTVNDNQLTTMTVTELKTNELITETHGVLIRLNSVL